jgi:hypothetical protein
MTHRSCLRSCRWGGLETSVQAKVRCIVPCRHACVFGCHSCAGRAAGPAPPQHHVGAGARAAGGGRWRGSCGGEQQQPSWLRGWFASARGSRSAAAWGFACGDRPTRGRRGSCRAAAGSCPWAANSRSSRHGCSLRSSLRRPCAPRARCGAAAHSALAASPAQPTSRGGGAGLRCTGLAARGPRRRKRCWPAAGHGALGARGRVQGAVELRQDEPPPGAAGGAVEGGCRPLRCTVWLLRAVRLAGSHACCLHGGACTADPRRRGAQLAGDDLA